MNKMVVVLMVILMPGVIATIISDKLTSHSKWDSFKFTLYAITLGIFAYSLLQIVVYAIDLMKSVSLRSIQWSHLDIWNSALNGSSNIRPWEICAATVFAIPVAFLASWSINFKIFNKIANKIKVSNKYGDENLFSYYLNAREIDWVYVRDMLNNFTYEGRVVSHSENDKMQEIVLSEVKVYRYEDSDFLYSVPTMYLSRGMGEFIIEAIPKDNLGDSDE